MDQLDAKKLYRGIIIALISTVVPLVLLGSVQLIVGIKVSKDNAEAIKEIREDIKVNYMSKDLIERYIVLLEERDFRNREICIEIKNSIEILDIKLDTELKDIYKQIKNNAYGRSRGVVDTLNITYNGKNKRE